MTRSDKFKASVKEDFDEKKQTCEAMHFVISHTVFWQQFQHKRLGVLLHVCIYQYLNQDARTSLQKAVDSGEA